MKVAVIGTGYVGLMQAAGLAKLGHNVVGIDIDAAKVERLTSGEVPFFEEGLAELVHEGVASGALIFTTDYEKVRDAEVIFVCVQTPQAADASCDLTFFLRALSDIGTQAKSGAVVVMKSTVPPGSTAKYRAALGREDIELASNPEFLREGRAVHDFFHPARTVIGVESDASRAKLEELYKDIPGLKISTSIETAQLAKYASNAMLASRLSLMNEIANVAQAVGAYVKDVEHIVGSDPRIGESVLRTGAGFGGSCFPKDVLALDAAARAHGYDPKLIAPIIEVNTKQAKKFVENIMPHLSRDACVAVWGLAFNHGTDDVRESPALRVIAHLLERGVHVMAYDPRATDRARLALGDTIAYVQTKEDALVGAEALLVLTEWDEFLSADWNDVKNRLTSPIIGDGKHILPHDILRGLGFTVIGIGI